jgi:hypothetical protein
MQLAELQQAAAKAAAKAAKYKIKNRSSFF